VTNLNKLIQETEFENSDLETIVKQSKGAIFNNAAQVWNHTFYFEGLKSPNHSMPLGALEQQINQDFGSYDAFKESFTKSALGLFGSGWVWLVKNAEGSLEIIPESNAGNPMPYGKIPILTMDVWEHAYYLDYQNRRADYISGFWSIINWEVAGKRF
jgi:superoxide dismutase, Fe-Mn family